MNQSYKKREGLEDNFELTYPNITFNDRMTLRFGDITVDMRYLGAAHTDGDIIIYVPEEKLPIVGDVFHYSYLPGID